tara:strand:- start:593 stop:778 length:186 start_codon:yes stop_codon:yes gene_type:complete
MRDPTDKERHWFLKLNNVMNKEELEKIIAEVNDPEKGAKDEWKSMILQRAEAKKIVMGWNQ